MKASALETALCEGWRPSSGTIDKTRVEVVSSAASVSGSLELLIRSGEQTFLGTLFTRSSSV
jgi:hypothetical protein